MYGEPSTWTKLHTNYLQIRMHSGWIVMQWMESGGYLQMHCTIWQCDGNGMECDGAAAMGTDTAERRMDGDMAIGNASTLDEMGWLYCLKRDATLDHDAHHIVILAIRTTHPQIFDDCSKCTLAHTRTQQPEASLKRQRPRPPKRLPSRAQTRGLCAKSGLALPSTDPRVSEQAKRSERSERAVHGCEKQHRV